MTIVKSLLAAASLATVVLAGCAPYQKSNWTPSESPPIENQVRWIESKHVVRFAAGEAALSPGERGRLDAFLGLARPEYNDRVYVLADEGALEARRVGSLRDYLLENNITGRQIMAGMAADDGANELTLVIGRYIVIPPGCPNWSKPSSADPNNRVSSNFGCATATNLGAMLADPGDLVVGKPMDAGDGTVSAGSVRRYRTDKVKELPTDPTRTKQDAAK